MRILLLGDSNDLGDWVPPERRKHNIVAQRLAAELGEPVEFVVKGLWPNPGIADRVAAWIDEAQPDVVYLNTASYWFLYRSVPLRVKRIFRRLGGERAGDVGFKLANSPRWGHNAVFRGARRLLQSTIGGDTHFTCEQSIQRMAECLRVATREESTVVVVKGPHGKARYGARRREYARDERERLKFHHALEALCAQVHATYDGVGEGGVRHLPAYQKGTTVGDGLHANEARHLHEAEVLYAGIRAGLQASGRVPA